MTAYVEYATCPQLSSFACSLFSSMFWSAPCHSSYLTNVVLALCEENASREEMMTALIFRHEHPATSGSGVYNSRSAFYWLTRTLIGCRERGMLSSESIAAFQPFFSFRKPFSVLKASNIHFPPPRCTTAKSEVLQSHSFPTTVTHRRIERRWCLTILYRRLSLATPFDE